MNLRNLAVATAGMAIFAAAALAQVSGVEGIVKSADGKPVQGAIVMIHRTDMKGDWQTKPTDKKGHYIYNGLPYGATYTLTLMVDGQKADEVSGVRPSPGEIKDVPFDLKVAKADKAAQQAAAQKALESGKIDDDLARGLSKEQKEALQKQIEKQAAANKKNKELNDSFNNGVNAATAAKAMPATDKDGQAAKWQEAIDNFNKAGEMDPNQVAVWTNDADAYMGLAADKTGPDHDAALGKALESYQKALALKPDDASIHVNYGVALSKANKFPEMQAEFEKAATLDPTQACKSYFNLGAVLTNAGQTDQALGAFQKATQLDPNCADAYYQSGVTLMAKATTTPDGKIVPAAGTLEALQKYLQLQPQGKYAQSAQELITTLGSTVEMSYKDPNAKTTKKKK